MPTTTRLGARDGRLSLRVLVGHEARAELDGLGAGDQLRENERVGVVVVRLGRGGDRLRVLDRGRTPRERVLATGHAQCDAEVAERAREQLDLGGRHLVEPHDRARARRVLRVDERGGVGVGAREAEAVLVDAGAAVEGAVTRSLFRGEKS